LPPPRVLNVDHGRKRFLLFPVLEAAKPGPCVLPALAWVDAPAPGAEAAKALAVRGWAFKDGAGLRGVDVVLDDTRVFPARYGLDDPGVADYWEISTDPNHPRVGFEAKVDLRGIEPGTHWLGLRLHASDGSVEDWPQQRLEVR
jgi:hypothetical protein